MLAGSARPAHEGVHVLEKLRQLFDFEFTVAQLIAIGLILGTPYLLIGAVWTSSHTEHLHQLHGLDLAVSYLGSIAAWPLLIFANVCMT
jgi:NADH:ubiquinone oxidoreductase subunit 4 (subunit M)